METFWDKANNFDDLDKIREHIKQDLILLLNYDPFVEDIKKLRKKYSKPKLNWDQDVMYYTHIGIERDFEVEISQWLYSHVKQKEILTELDKIRNKYSININNLEFILNYFLYDNFSGVPIFNFYSIKSGKNESELWNISAVFSALSVEELELYKAKLWDELFFNSKLRSSNGKITPFEFAGNFSYVDATDGLMFFIRIKNDCEENMRKEFNFYFKQIESFIKRKYKLPKLRPNLTENIQTIRDFERMKRNNIKGMDAVGKLWENEEDISAIADKKRYDRLRKNKERIIKLTNKKFEKK